MNNRLLKIVQSTVHRGVFKLKSGEISDYYLDIRSLFGDPKIMKLITKAMVEKIPNQVTCIAASGYGGISLGTLISQMTNLPLILVRNESKKHGLKDLIIGYQPTNKDTVLIVDDVCTQGTSIKETMNILKQKNVKKISTLVLVKRGNPVGISKPLFVFSIKEIMKGVL